MKQRAALLRTYLFSEKVALLDEPFSALDMLTKSAVHEWYLDVMEKIHLSTIFITHDIDEVVSSDYVIAMHEGHVAMTGTPEEIFRQEKKLEEIQLDLPFSVKLIRELKKDGVKVGRTLTMEGLVDELCRLHSNM